MILEIDIQGRTIEERQGSHFDSNKIYWIHNDKELKPDSFVDEEMHSRVIDTGEELTIQIPCLVHQASDEPVVANLFIYLKDNYCWTASTVAIPAIDSVKKDLFKNLKYALTPGFILFLILDEVINEYSTLLQKFEVVADDVDIETRELHEGAYSKVMEIKKQITKIKHHVSSLRDVVMRISGRKIAVISEPCRLALIDLFAHTQTIVNETDTINDILGTTLDLIDNSLMQKMSAAMKILTAFSAIFLPLAVITGIYGMNFHGMPEIEWEYGYLYALTLMALCAGVLIMYFKKKKWFD
ncbi:MAG: magnesium transporter [Verrucomicrobia bacterium]|nr:magnesium transporter [Verrucomicrobiota bacterium]